MLGYIASTFNVKLAHIVGYYVMEKKTKFDRFVDPNVRGAQRRVYSDLRICRH